MTASGRYFDPMNPRADDVHLPDIATALGRIVRFNGHTKRSIPVAEHCMRVARIAMRLAERRGLPAHMRPLIILLALLHDAAEAYIGDIVTPIKTDAMRAVERRVLNAIISKVWGRAESFAEALAMDADVHAAWALVKRADAFALYFEAMLWQTGASDWAPSLGVPADMVGEFLPDIVGEEREDWIAQVRAAVDALAIQDMQPSAE